ncbi:MAG TPA: MCE family protein [Bacteroidetes bacterium]|nr:MCE family protein [Bacteroidota bacterium]
MRKEVRIGLTILAGILLLYLTVAWIRSMHFFSANRATYALRFTDVSGLKEGDPVSVFGYPSGNVEAIGLDNEGAIVRINLDPAIDVREDASAEIRVKELMGGKLVSFVPGKSGNKLPENAQIMGTTSLDFSSAFSRVGEFLDLFDPQQVDSLIRNVNRIASTFARLGDEFDSLDTGALMGDLTGAAGSLNHILDDVEQRRIIAKVDGTLGQVDQLAAKADETLASVTKLTDQLSDQTLPKADRMLSKITDMLDDTEEMVVSLKKLVKQLENETTLAGKLLYDPEFAQNLEATLANLDKTLEHIRTKKIYVVMTTSKKQKVFDEAPVRINGKRVK